MPSGYEGTVCEVMLIDDEDLVRRGFRHALGEASDIAVVADARTGAEALRLAEKRRPQVILADTDVEYLHRLRRCTPGVIALAPSANRDDHLYRALAAGVRGFLLKNASQEELIYAVRSVARGGAFICPEMTRRLIDRFEILPPLDELATVGVLSDRERQVFLRIACGRSNGEIARELHLTSATVKSHVSHILAKLELPNRMHVALLAHRMGLVRPDVAGQVT